MAGDHIDTISRLDDLIATICSNLVCYAVQGCMYLSLSTSYWVALPLLCLRSHFSLFLTSQADRNGFVKAPIFSTRLRRSLALTNLFHVAQAVPLTSSHPLSYMAGLS
ncbi:hypothetical protein L210DRAFT_512999 [Boletus edulis BED1]|uniref:Uncharacterized protein n=1 Tax=Boletus edulis BED1 TaxID=1328754 RepID=A0AAD4BCY6_BOLED|nr:hypothetical protein L210DRAFT_512999 [Boletus edulis BED1]